MTENDSSSLPVRLSAAVKDRLERESDGRGVSINDVAVGILADHYDVPFQGTGRKSPGARGSTTVMLRLPGPLYEVIHRAALPPKTKNEVVERILCERFDLAYEPRRRGRKHVAAA